MKQRIRVVGIAKRGSDFLFLKRSRGRMVDGAVWELPTGKIRLGEQPEETMSRLILEELGVYTAKIILKDVVTFVAPIGASRLSNLYIVYEIQLREDEKIVPKRRYSAYKYMNLHGVTETLVDEASMEVISIEEGGINTEVVMRSVANGATVYVDGSSRGNPGPSGVGYYMVGQDGEVIGHGGDYIGFATSRVAEYRALRLGVIKARAMGLKSVRFVSDNLMMVNQMSGVYKIKNMDLLPLYREIKELVKDFEACAFVHVKREFNTQADREANLAIDRHFG